MAGTESVKLKEQRVRRERQPPESAEVRDILARLKKVERQNRWIVRAGLAVLLLGIVCLVGSLTLAGQQRAWFEKYAEPFPMTLMDYHLLDTNLQLIREKIMSDGMEPASLYFDHKSKKVRAQVVVNGDEIRNESMDSVQKKFSTAAIGACVTAGIYIDGFNFTKDCEVEFRGLRKSGPGDNDIEAVKFGDWKAGKITLQESVLVH